MSRPKKNPLRVAVEAYQALDTEQKESFRQIVDILEDKPAPKPTRRREPKEVPAT